MKSVTANVIITQTGPVLAIELNRPEKMNALDDDMFTSLRGAVSRAESDPEIRSVTLTGRGRGFCSGGDVSNMGSRTPAQTTERMRRHGSTLITSLLNLPKPVVVGVNGPAVGGGFALALAGDFILMSRDAYFAASFIERGLIPDMGSSFLLPRQVGLHRAKEMTMTGRRIDAEEARRLGLAAAVTEPDELAGAVRHQAEQLASRSMTAMALTKRLMNQSQENCLMSMLESEAMAQGLAVTDSEHRLAVDEFQRRRADRARDSRPAVPGGTA